MHYTGTVYHHHKKYYSKDSITMLFLPLLTEWNRKEKEQDVYRMSWYKVNKELEDAQEAQ